jgi:sugar O-acyltransferase (sialic acid O-acetyltransferase NeuD family)
LTGPLEQIVLVGSGGFGRETAELIRAINAAGTDGPRWDLLGFLDDEPACWGSSVSGTAVLGALDRLDGLPEARVVVCTGHPGNFASRRRIVERLALEPERYATLVHPAATIPASCTLGPGTVILAGVVATTDVEIGSHVAVMPQAVFTHDDRLDDFVTVGSGVCLAGAVHVQEGAYLGGGALVREHRTIGRGALVGMGAVVTQDVPGSEVWAGVPARRLRAVKT